MIDVTKNNPLANLISAANELGLDGDLIVGFYEGKLVHLGISCSDDEAAPVLETQAIGMAAICSANDKWRWEAYSPPVKH